MDSLETQTSGGMHESPINVEKRDLVRRRWARLPDPHRLQEPDPACSCFLNEVLLESKKDEADMSPSRVNTRARVTSDNSLLDVRPSFHTESIRDLSAPPSANSAARASSIMSISRSFCASKLCHVDLHRDIARDVMEINCRLSAASTYQQEVGSPPSLHASERGSLQNEQPLRSARYSLPSGDGHHSFLSGTTERSFDLSKVPFSFTRAPPLPMSQTSHGPRTPAESVMPTTPGKVDHIEESVVQPATVRSARPRSVRAGRRASKTSSRGAHSVKPTPPSHTRTTSSLAHLMSCEPVQRPFRWKPVTVRRHVT